MTFTPKKYYERERNRVHCDRAHGSDFTLCGFTLDGDQGEITETSGSRIDCPDCLAVIRFCRSISARSLTSAEREGGK